MTKPDLTGAPATPRPIHWAGTIALGIIWGTSFLSMALALDGFPPLWVATGRLLIGGLTLLAVERALALAGMLRTGAPPPWPFVVGTGLFAAALPFALLTWGLQSVPSAFAGVSMAAVALFVLPLAHVFVPGERMTRRKAAGTVIGFAGVVLLIAARSSSDSGEEPTDRLLDIRERITWPTDRRRVACLPQHFGCRAPQQPVAVATWRRFRS